MSIANETLRSLEQENNTMRFNHAVLDYKLNDVSSKKKPTFRQWFLFIMLCASLTIFFVDRIQVEPDVRIEESLPVTIDEILVEKDFIKGNEKEENTAVEIPKSVMDFIEYKLLVEKEAVDEIVIYEIIDHNKINQQINQLLVEADTLFKKDHLTSPKVENAFEKYESVLVLDNTNREALAGIQRIVDRYIYFVESVIKKNETYKIPGLIRSAQKVGGNYINMVPLIDKYKQYLDEETIFISLPREPTSAGHAPKKEYVDVDFPSLSEGQSIIDVDDEIAKVALSLWQNNDQKSAQKILENFTQLSDYWGKSYDLLLKIYIETENLALADNLVYKNKTLDLFQLAEKAARIFDARNDAQGAIDLLDSHTPSIEDYPEYYALKAGLYHKAGHYHLAVDLYKQLLGLSYEDARYWLGLAVSLDAMGDDDALKAFHFANQYAMPGSSVKRYIEQRIVVLAN